MPNANKNVYTESQDAAAAVYAQLNLRYNPKTNRPVYSPKPNWQYYQSLKKVMKPYKNNLQRIRKTVSHKSRGAPNYTFKPGLRYKPGNYNDWVWKPGNRKPQPKRKPINRSTEAYKMIKNEFGL